uniref:Cleavage and polyadenylation specificity factor subunit 3-I-like isoform X2 n=2 Tax=Nicotiana tabacum TaxID=4097 RepID=A0A1S4CZA1_TOBAC|nr:PREDICTED: cleavage and polyadenylation specificity factor subunit 3-I-like isoform X2 [Nicotiana tabacum]
MNLRADFTSPSISPAGSNYSNRPCKHLQSSVQDLGFRMASTGQPQSTLKRPSSAVNREGDKLIITPLGAGNEVGRSCVYMSFKGKTVLFDCGIHPAYPGMAALPYFDEIDPSTIDVLLITQLSTSIRLWK